MGALIKPPAVVVISTTYDKNMRISAQPEANVFSRANPHFFIVCS